MSSKKINRRNPQEIVQRFFSSNTTQKRFCRQHDLAISTLQYWLRRHRQEQPNHEKSVFLPVEVSTGPTANRLFQTCEIEYPNGVRIRFSEPVSVSFLVQLALAKGL